MYSYLGSSEQKCLIQNILGVATFKKQNNFYLNLDTLDEIKTEYLSLIENVCNDKHITLYTNFISQQIIKVLFNKGMVEFNDLKYLTTAELNDLYSIMSKTVVKDKVNYESLSDFCYYQRNSNNEIVNRYIAKIEGDTSCFLSYYYSDLYYGIKDDYYISEDYMETLDNYAAEIWDEDINLLHLSYEIDQPYVDCISKLLANSSNVPVICYSGDGKSIISYTEKTNNIVIAILLLLASESRCNHV